MAKLILFLTFLLFLQHHFAAAREYETCFTRRTSPSPRSITSTTVTKTVTIPRTVVVTTTPGKTVTPPPVTTTSTVTTTKTAVTDIPQLTGTLTVFTTVKETTTTTLSTVTVAQSTTVTTTTTTTIPVTTIGAPAGFTPLLDTLPGSMAKKKRSNVEDKRAGSRSLLARGKSQPFCPPVKGGKPSWPVAVTCYKLVKVFKPTTITRRAKKTTTTTIPAVTAVVSSTVIVTVTSTATTPDATATATSTIISTETSTVSPTTTTTETQTVTVTVETAAATVYAACGASSRNFVGSINGFGIDTAFSNNNQNYNTVNNAESTKEGCCSSCLANPLCIVTAFEGDFPPGSKCYLVISGQPTCAISDYSLGAIYNNPPLPPGGGYFLSNGNCGRYDTAIQT